MADTEFRFSVGVKQKNIGVDQSAVVMDTSIHTVEIPILYPSPARPLANESLIMNNVIVEVLAKDLNAQGGVF